MKIICVYQDTLQEEALLSMQHDFDGFCSLNPGLVIEMSKDELENLRRVPIGAGWYSRGENGEIELEAENWQV